MKESELLERYAMALQLVPDPDVAGDLFMSASHELTLLHRANRWRVRQGLPELALPTVRRPLSPVEADHARHLARRGRLRWRLAAAGGALVLAVGVGLGAFLLLSLRAPLHGLAASPVFAEAPLQQITHPAGYRVAIHRVEAHPGAVTVWWSARGANAGRAGATLDPRLQLDSAAPEWLEPGETVLAASRPTRTVGRSSFPTIVTVEREALLAFGDPRGSRSGVLLRLPLEHLVPDTTATVVALNRRMEQGPITLHLHELIRGQNYTQVRYSASPGIARGPALYTLQVGNVRLNRKGPLVMSQDGQWIEATFGPLPQELDHLSLTFTSVFVALPPRTYTLDQVELFTHSGSVATMVMALEDQSWGAVATGHFTAVGGARYPATLSFQVEGNPARHRIMLRSEEIPAGVDLASYTLNGLRLYYHFMEIPVRLQPTH